MAGSGVLGADMGQLGRWLRGGAHWWLAELAGLVPERLRGRDEALRLHPPEAGQGWRLLRRGRSQPVAAGAREQVTIVAPARSVLVRTVALPALPPADLRRMLALDLDRLAPLPAAEAMFDWRIVARDPARERVEVLLGVMRREEVERLRDEAAALGFRPVRIAAPTPEGTLRFDFLRELIGDSPTVRARRWWWGVVAALFVLALALLIGRDIVATQRLEEAVDAAAPAAAAAHALQARVARERRQQARAIVLRDRHEPLRVLAAVSGALPPGAWVQRLAWDGHTVRIAGFKDRGLDVLGALRRSPLFRDVREGSGDAASQAAAAQPYDIAALVVPSR